MKMLRKTADAILLLAKIPLKPMFFKLSSILKGSKILKITVKVRAKTIRYVKIFKKNRTADRYFASDRKPLAICLKSLLYFISRLNSLK